MTTEPNEPTEPAGDDALEPAAAPVPDVRSDADDDDPDTDAMGINDDDPIDATLVGKPVEARDGPSS